MGLIEDVVTYLTAWVTVSKGLSPAWMYTICIPCSVCTALSPAHHKNPHGQKKSLTHFSLVKKKAQKW